MCSVTLEGKQKESERVSSSFLCRDWPHTNSTVLKRREEREGRRGKKGRKIREGKKVRGKKGRKERQERKGVLSRCPPTGCLVGKSYATSDV